ncbi:cellulose-binding protein [Streptomyces sp. CA-278952]|uniref:cellulose-binding protein n=1 Tax=Streptomyces sp. CA-278952 TaxID=2980556 RepID=UPI002367DD4A|nr:cellulose-binding protein [Streptomyces sp. CA-278952]WDG30791.1 cellulose-binding protein [Streptomyces sp. CA-278952]
MSAGPGSAYDVVGVRGRGYRPEQVDRVAAALVAERDGALAELTRLTGRVEELLAESARLAEAVATLPVQDYAELGERAQRILALAESEAEALDADAVAAGQALRDAAEAAGRVAGDAAREAAGGVRAAADRAAEERVAGAVREAEGLLAAARQDAEEVRAAAASVMAATRDRTASVLAHQEQEHAERLKAAEAEMAAAEAASEARFAGLTERAEALLAEAGRDLAATQEVARHGQEDAEARAAELLAEARVREERVVRETERILREHEEGREEAQAHMAHVRSSLAALTGRVASGD